MANLLNESLPPALGKPDPWEERMASLVASNRITTIDGPMSETATHLTPEEWYPIITLRSFFSERVILGYKKRLSKDEILQLMEEKQLFKRILTMFLGGQLQMLAAQDQLIRSLERTIMLSESFILK